MQRRLQNSIVRLGPARRLARHVLLPRALRRPQHVALEVTAACNARCIMCPHHETDRLMRPMDLVLFRKVVDECAALGVEANILRLVAIRQELRARRPTVRVGMIAMPENRHEITAFLETWQGKVDFVEIDGLHNRLPGIDPALCPGQARRCFEPWQRLNVWANGQAVLCCEDWNGTHVVGDARVQTVGEIWEGGPMQAARHAHESGAGRGIALCAGCSAWRAGPASWA